MSETSEEQIAHKIELAWVADKIAPKPIAWQTHLAKIAARAALAAPAAPASGAEREPTAEQIRKARAALFAFNDWTQLTTEEVVVAVLAAASPAAPASGTEWPSEEQARQITNRYFPPWHQYWHECYHAVFAALKSLAPRAPRE